MFSMETSLIRVMWKVLEDPREVYTIVEDDGSVHTYMEECGRMWKTKKCGRVV